MSWTVSHISLVYPAQHGKTNISSLHRNFLYVMSRSDVKNCIIFTIKKGLSFLLWLFLVYFSGYFPTFGINSVLIKYTDGTTHICAFSCDSRHDTQTSVTSQSSASELTLFLLFFCWFLLGFFRTMSNLYEDPDWSQKDLKETLKDVRKHVLKNKFFTCFAPDRLKYYLKELCQRKQEGHQICFTDLWGLIIETMLHEKVQ